ncbi:MAG: hypothetical protein Q4D38_07890 [Planctomycetia bacterium]|nr:hypothetical protein [Planctomycetia bacterium]
MDSSAKFTVESPLFTSFSIKKIFVLCSFSFKIPVLHNVLRAVVRSSNGGRNGNLKDDRCKVALIACARKLLIILNSLIRSRRKWENRLQNTEKSNPISTDTP